MTENSATTCLRSHDLSRYQGQAFPGDEEILQLLQQMPCLLRPHENDNKADTKNPSPVFDLSLPSDVEPGSAEQMDPAWFVNVVVTVTDRNGCVIYHEAHFPKNPWLRNGIKNFVDLRWGDFVHPPDMEIWNQHLFEAFHEADRWRAARLAASQTPPSPSGTSNTFLLFTTAGPITSGEEHTIRRRRISSGGPSSSGSSTGGHQQHVVSTTSRLSPDMTDLKTVEALLHRRFIVSPLYRAHWGCPGGHGSVFYFRTVSLPFLRHQSCEEDDTGKTGRSRGHKSSSSSSTSNSSGTTETIGVFSPTSSFENLLLMSYHCILGKVPEDALLEAVGSGETTVFDPATLRVSEKPTDLIKSSNCIASPLDDLTRAFCFGSILDEDFDSSDQTSGRSKNPSEMIAQDPRSPSGAATTFTNSNGSSSSSNSHLAPADIDWIDQSLESLQQLEQRPPGEATFAAAESNPASQVCSSKHGRDLVGGGREHPDAGVDGMIAGTSSRSPRSSVTAELSKATCQNDRISIFLGLLLPEAIREIKEAVSAEPDMVARRVRAIVTRHLGPEILSKFFSSSNSTNHQWQQQRQDQSISPGSFAGATTSTVASTSTPTTLTATSVASSVKTTTTPTTSAGQQWMTPEPRDVANSFDEGMDQVASALVSPPPPPLAPPASTSAATAPASNRSHSSTTAPHPLLKESLSAPSGVFSQPPKRPSLVQELSVSSENAVGGEGDCASAPPPPPPPGFYESFSSKSRTAPTPSGQTSGTTTPASFDSMSGTSPWMHRSSTTQLPALPPSTNSQSHPPSAPAPRIPKNTSSASSTSSSSSQEVHSTAGVLESLLMGGYVAPDSSRPRRISGSSASSAAATTMRQRNASEATGGGLSLSLAECQPTLSNSGPSSACCPVPKVPGTSMSFAFEIDEWPMVSSSSGSRGSPSRTTRTATNASRGSRVSQVLVSPNSASSCSSLAHLLRHGCPPSTTDNSGPSVAPSAMATAGATATTTTTTTATATTTTTSTTVAAAAVVTTGGSISSPVVVSSPALLTTACATRANRIASRQQLQEQAPPPPPTAPTNRTSPQSRPLDCPLSIIVDPQPQQPLAPNSSKNLLIPSHSSMLSGSYDDAKLSLTAMTTTGSTEPTMTSIPRRTQSPPKTIYGPDFATCMPTKAEFLLYHPPNSQQRSHQGYYQRQQQLNSAQPPPPPPRKKSREDEEAIMANSSLCRLLQAPDPNWDTLTIEVDAAAAQEVWDPSSSTTAPPTVPPPPPPSFANLPPDLLVANDFNQLQHQTRGLDHQRQMNTMANTPPNHGSASSTSAAMMEASVASPANLESNRRAAAVAAAQIAEEAESQSRHLSNAHNCYEGTQGMGPMSQKGLGTTNANNRCRPAQSQGNAPICYSSGSDSSGGTSNPGSLELLQPASCSTNLNAGEPDALVDFDMISVVLPPTIPPPPSQQQQQTTTAVASSSRLEDFSRRLKEIAPNVSVSPSRSQHQQNQCQQNPRQQLPQQQQQPPPPPPPPAMYANENHNHLQQQQQHSNHQNLHSQGYQQQKTQPSQQIVQMQPPPPSYEFSGGHLAPVTYDYQDSQNLGGQSRYQRYQPPPQQQQQQVVTCNAPAPQGHYHQQQQQSMPPPPPQYASHQQMAAIQPKMAQHHPHPHAQYHQHQSSYYHHQNPPIAGYHHHQQQQHLQERRYGYEEAPPQPPPQYGYQQGGHQHHHHGSHQHPSALLMQQQLHQAMPPQRAQPNCVSPLTMALQQNQTQQHAQVKVNLRKKVTGRCQPRSNVEPSVAASGGVPGGYGVAANGNAVAPPQPPSPACLRTGQKRSHPSEEYYYAPQSRQAQQQQQPPPPPAPAYRQPFDTAQPVGVMDNSVAMEEMPFTDPAGAYDFCDAPVTPSQHDFNSMVFVNAPDTSQHQMMLQRQQYPPASNCRLDNIKAVSASDVCTSSISHLNDDIQLTDDIVNDVLDLEGLL